MQENKVSIEFGTSGLRGPAVGFTPERVAAYTGAFLDIAGAPERERTLLVGADLRDSSPRIAATVIAAARSSGWNVNYAGNVPTPALAHAAFARECPAIMVTGSHIPGSFNGLKFYRRAGELLKGDEAPIRAEAAKRLAEGSVIVPEVLPEPDISVAHAYVERFTSAFPADALGGLRLGVDLHSAAGRDLLVTILERLGASCFPFRRLPEFVAVDTEALSGEDLERAKSWIVMHHLDAVVSTDGDGDRPLLVDEQGRQVNGDILGLLSSRTLGIARVVTPLNSTSAIEKSGFFDAVERTRIGSPYVVEAMMRQEQVSTAGFEANGGYLLGTDVELGTGKLRALPTRDAVLPLLAVLSEITRREISVSVLVSELPSRIMKSDRIKHVSSAAGDEFLKELSNSEEARMRLHPLLKTPAGVDHMDGLRFTLQDGRIIHFRQSGNAPELRCYVEADSAEDAGIVLSGLVGRLSRSFAGSTAGSNKG